MITNIAFQYYWNTKIAVFSIIFTFLAIFKLISQNSRIQDVSLGHKKIPQLQARPRRPLLTPDLNICILTTATGW
jgi:hypothetical protein